MTIRFWRTLWLPIRRVERFLAKRMIEKARRETMKDLRRAVQESEGINKEVCRDVCRVCNPPR